MPPPNAIDWTKHDARLLDLRAAGLPFGDIAKVLNVGTDTARKRWNALNGRPQSSCAGSWRPSRDLIRLREVCADAFGVRDQDLVRRTRVRTIAHARQATCFVIRATRPKLSYPCIASMLGGLDHSTVIHGVRATQDRMARDPELAARIETLVAIFGARADARQHDSHVTLYREHMRRRIAEDANASERQRIEAQRRAKAEAEALASLDDEYVAALDRRRIECSQCDRAVLPTEAARCTARLCGARAAAGLIRVAA